MTNEWEHAPRLAVLGTPRLQKENPKLESREKNREIISSNCLQHHKRASSFTNKHKAAQLHLLPMLSRYRRMSESVHHDKQCSSLYDRWCFCHDEQCSSLHAEGLSSIFRFTVQHCTAIKWQNMNTWIHFFHSSTSIFYLPITDKPSGLLKSFV